MVEAPAMTSRLAKSARNSAPTQTQAPLDPCPVFPEPALPLPVRADSLTHPLSFFLSVLPNKGETAFLRSRSTFHNTPEVTDDDDSAVGGADSIGWCCFSHHFEIFGAIFCPTARFESQLNLPFYAFI